MALTDAGTSHTHLTLSLASLSTYSSHKMRIFSRTTMALSRLLSLQRTMDSIKLESLIKLGKAFLNNIVVLHLGACLLIKTLQFN